MKVFAGRKCAGCGIDLSDGYVIGCEHCRDRRLSRLRRGEKYTPTGYSGEAIDNNDPKGRLVPG